MTTDQPLACPVCGNALTIPRTGRPPRWCSKACRQAGYRARLAADRAAAAAARCLGQLATARTTLNAAGNELASAYAEMTLAATEAGDSVDVMLRTGARWEMPLRDAARELQRAAGRIAELAHQHDQAAADYRAARAVYAGDRAPLASRAGSCLQ